MKATGVARHNTVLGIDRGTFYRQVRALHGYLSALCFIILMAFSATGILLNHPGLIASSKPANAESTISLGKDEIARALESDSPAMRLADAVAAKTSPRGAYKSGEIIDSEAQLRFEGVSGTTDVTIDLKTGSTDVMTARASFLQVVNDLHRGKNAGQVWSAIIDISAILILLMSALGYVIFLSLRFRMRTALVLTAISFLGLVGIYAAFVP